MEVFQEDKDLTVVRKFVIVLGLTGIEKTWTIQPITRID